MYSFLIGFLFFSLALLADFNVSTPPPVHDPSLPPPRILKEDPRDPRPDYQRYTPVNLGKYPRMEEGECKGGVCQGLSALNRYLYGSAIAPGTFTNFPELLNRVKLFDKGIESGPRPEFVRMNKKLLRVTDPKVVAPLAAEIQVAYAGGKTTAGHFSKAKLAAIRSDPSSFRNAVSLLKYVKDNQKESGAPLSLYSTKFEAGHSVNAMIENGQLRIADPNSTQSGTVEATVTNTKNGIEVSYLLPTIYGKRRKVWELSRPGLHGRKIETTTPAPLQRVSSLPF